MPYLTLDEAAAWASKFINKNVTPTNISYLIQYGRIKKHGSNGNTLVEEEELRSYYERYLHSLRNKYQERLGADINWELSFSRYKEKDTTKHVHRLHPYKGKFIPQLVEYFLDGHTDNFKKIAHFSPGDVVLDPFAGSGTTLVQANELGLHSIGIDISYFNCLISEVKLQKYDLAEINNLCQDLSAALKKEKNSSKIGEFEKELDLLIAEANKKHFPSPDYKYSLARALVDEEEAAAKALDSIRGPYASLLKKYKLSFDENPTGSEFLNTWFAPPLLREALVARRFTEAVNCEKNRKLLVVLLSRTLRSCRLTPHYQLESLSDPVRGPYYCWKHMKICRPLFSMVKVFDRYSRDTLKRLAEFDALRKDAFFILLDGDSRRLDIFEEIRKKDPSFYNMLVKKKIKGIFTSPPYVGQLDYHAQHEYAYEFFGFCRRDDLEIGRSGRGKGAKAREDYVRGISDVLINCKRYLSDDSHIYIVANDEYGLYPEIARLSGLKVVETFKRPVLNRTSRDRNAYGESIFHMIRRC